MSFTILRGKQLTNVGISNLSNNPILADIADANLLTVELGDSGRAIFGGQRPTSGVGAVLRLTTNYGATWANIESILLNYSGTITNHRVSDIVFFPSFYIYTGTDTLIPNDYLVLVESYTEAGAGFHSISKYSYNGGSDASAFTLVARSITFGGVISNNTCYISYAPVSGYVKAFYTYDTNKIACRIYNSSLTLVDSTLDLFASTPKTLIGCGSRLTNTVPLSSVFVHDTGTDKMEDYIIGNTIASLTLNQTDASVGIGSSAKQTISKDMIDGVNIGTSIPYITIPITGGSPSNRVLYCNDLGVIISSSALFATVRNAAVVSDYDTPEEPASIGTSGSFMTDTSTTITTGTTEDLNDLQVNQSERYFIIVGENCTVLRYNY